MGLVSSRYMTQTQLEHCCRDGVSPGVIGYAIYTEDGQRIGKVNEVLIDDESMAVAWLIVDTSTAGFVINQRHVMLPTNLCCWDEERRAVRSLSSTAQVQSAPRYDAAVDLARAYEEAAIFNFGERPNGPADH